MTPMTISVSADPFGRAPHHAEVEPGRTVLEVLTDLVAADVLALRALPHVCVYVNGARLERDETLRHVLTTGEVVSIVVEPLGRGGGDKDVGQVLMSIAVIAVSAWVGGGTFLPTILSSAFRQQVAAAVVLTLGQALVASLYQPDREGAAKVNDRYALQTASNQYRPWAPMPLALGEVIAAPDMAVKSFTRAIGDDVWIYGILGVHLGPCEVSDEKIGDTLISSMGAGDIQIVRHLTPGPRTFTLYPNDTDQLDLQEQLNATPYAATPVVRAASSEGERFEFDFFLPRGLFYQKDDGRKLTAELSVTIRYRPVDQDGDPTGGGTWQAGRVMPLQAATNEPWRVTTSLALPLGRYEFEVQRSVLIDDNPKRVADIGWTALRAIAFRKPITDETLSIIEFAVRATAVNQGTLAPITCRIRPICQTWTGAEWGPPVATSNPAALTRWLLTGPAPAIPLPPEQADVRLRQWSEVCDANEWTSHIYLTEDRKQDAVLAMLEHAGRGSLFFDGSQIAALPWIEKPAPRQLFAGDNLKDHRWTLVYPQPVHALRVEFQNLDQGGEPDELYVYADGYAEQADPGAGVQAATLVEAMRLDGQKTEVRAYLDGLWALGQRKYQRRIDTWTCDMEALTAGYGARVRLGIDRLAASPACRVRNRLWVDGRVAGLRLAQPVEFEPGKTYGLDLRLADQLIPAAPVHNPAVAGPVIDRFVVFAAPREPGLSPKAGDLVAFGETERISEDVEIVGIEPGPGLTAVLTGIRYAAPQLMADQAAALPIITTRLSRDRSRTPPAPQLLGIDARLDGIRVGFAMKPWRGSPITGFSARWRPEPEAGQEAGWNDLPTLGATAMALTTPPVQELPRESDDITAIQIEVRASTASGQVSPPLLVTVEYQSIGVVGQGPGAARFASQSIPFATSATEDTISILAFTGILDNGAQVSIPEGDVVGLSPFSSYGVFWRQGSGFEAELSPATAHMSAGSWIFIGWQSTSDAEGAYPGSTTPPGGWGGEGPYCPAPEEVVLLANDDRTGPGVEVAAGEVVGGRDWVWTQHERTLEWGAHPVLAARRIEGQKRARLTLADGRTLTAARTHRLFPMERGWSDMVGLVLGEWLIGQRPGEAAGVTSADDGPVVAFTIGEARTLIVNGLLSHNRKTDTYPEPIE